MPLHRSHRPRGRAAWSRCFSAALLAVVVGFHSASVACAEPAASEERLSALEQEVAALRAELARLAAAAPAPAAASAPAAPAAVAPSAGGPELAELARRVDLLAGEIEKLRLGEAAPTADAPQNGLGPAASKVYRARPGISIGGYGEFLYQSPAGRRDDGARAGDDATLDALRGIVYVGYKFDDRWLFNSELEVEHAKVEGEEEGGEVALEFAYLDYRLRRELGFRAGLLLVPMGFLSELHEPTTYLGARRPDVERSIIPTTWRENGLGLFGEIGPFTYRSYLLAGLDAEGFSAAGIRGGRQEGSESRAGDLGWVGRLDYTARPGLFAGVSAYVGDAGQGLRDARGRRIAARTTLVEGHLEWRWRGVELRALGARGTIGDAARLDGALGFTGAESIGERQTGGYVQVGYDVLASRRSHQGLIPYARWERYDTQAAVPAGFARDPANDVETLTLGLAWRPLPQVILKTDWQDVDNAAGTGRDQWNVALGYVF